MNVDETLKAFVGEGNSGVLRKVETTHSSKVGAGYSQSGMLSLIEPPPGLTGYQVAVVRLREYLRTSPVVEILEQKDNFLKFKTESGGVYELTKDVDFDDAA